MQSKDKAKVHSVRANLQILELTRAGSAMEFEIYANKEKKGTILIGSGSFTWIGKGAPDSKTKQYSWTKFAELMDHLAKHPLRIKKDENV